MPLMVTQTHLPLTRLSTALAAVVFPFTLASVLIAHPTAAAAQQAAAGTLVITGRILNQDNSPVANARVVISSMGGMAAADSTGRFIIPQAAAGVHAIEIAHEATITVQIPALNLPAGDTVHLHAILQPKSTTNPAADSASRVELQQRGGRGASQTPLLIVDRIMMALVTAPRDTALVRDISTMETVAIHVLTGTAALQMFGARGRSGVIRVVTRALCPRNVTEIDASCRGG
jgi:hypothetical protein